MHPLFQKDYNLLIMKMKIVWLFLAFCLFSGCEKENSSDLVGKWIWKETCNLNLYIGCLKSINVKEKKYLEFTNEDEIIFTTGDSITLRQKFKLAQDYHNRIKENINVIKIGESFFQSYSIRHDTLILADTCFACNFHVYKKIGD